MTTPVTAPGSRVARATTVSNYPATMGTVGAYRKVRLSPTAYEAQITRIAHMHRVTFPVPFPGVDTDGRSHLDYTLAVLEDLATARRAVAGDLGSTCDRLRSFFAASRLDTGTTYIHPARPVDDDGRVLVTQLQLVMRWGVTRARVCQILRGLAPAATDGIRYFYDLAAAEAHRAAQRNTTRSA